MHTNTQHRKHYEDVHKHQICEQIRLNTIRLMFNLQYLFSSHHSISTDSDTVLISEADMDNYPFM